MWLRVYPAAPHPQRPNLQTLQIMKKKKKILLKTSLFKRIPAVILFHVFDHGVKVRTCFIAHVSSCRSCSVAELPPLFSCFSPILVNPLQAFPELPLPAGAAQHKLSLTSISRSSRPHWSHDFICYPPPRTAICLCHKTPSRVTRQGGFL